MAICNLLEIVQHANMFIQVLCHSKKKCNGSSLVYLLQFFFIFRLSNDRVKNFAMNSSKSAQDVLRCHLCETPVPPLCCDVCQIYLCKVCAGEHILDESTRHLVVPIKQTLSALLYPKCLKHFSRNCELYCEQCIIPICLQCASSKEHRGHGVKTCLSVRNAKKKIQKQICKN